MARNRYERMMMEQPGIWMMARVAGERLPRGRRIVVNEWERMVVFRDGAVTDTLGPGAHRFWSGRITGRRVDIRPWILHVPTQEVPTADGLTIKVSVATDARVVDPVAYIVATQEALQAAYLYVQIAAPRRRPCAPRQRRPARRRVARAARAPHDPGARPELGPHRRARRRPPGHLTILAMVSRGIPREIVAGSESGQAVDGRKSGRRDS
jgi:hypothetical protein